MNMKMTIETSKRHSNVKLLSLIFILNFQSKALVIRIPYSQLRNTKWIEEIGINLISNNKNKIKSSTYPT